jgi:hypothetical protein
MSSYDDLLKSQGICFKARKRRGAGAVARESRASSPWERKNQNDLGRFTDTKNTLYGARPVRVGKKGS